MKTIPLPNIDDDAVVEATCNARSWANHLAVWKQSYQDYVTHEGDAVALKNWASAPIDDEIYKLYDAKAQNKDFKDLRSTVIGCCPMCGSDSTMDLDHFIPRSAFPEFAIFSKNLVPTCPYCNRGVKKETVMGSGPQDRFLHPYFHSLLDTPIWKAKFEPPFEAVKFGWEPLQTLPAADRSRVGFHLDHVLGEGFQKAAHGYWLGHLDGLMKAPAPTTEAASKRRVLRDTQQALKFTQPGTFPNGWRGAFFRGLVADRKARAWLSAELLKPRPPIL